MSLENAVKEIDKEILKLQNVRVQLAGAPLTITDFSTDGVSTWMMTSTKGAPADPAETTAQRQKREADARRQQRINTKLAKQPGKSVAAANGTPRKGPNPNHPLTGRPKPKSQIEKTLATKARLAEERKAAAASAAPPAIEPAPASAPAPAKKAAKKATKTKG